MKLFVDTMVFLLALIGKRSETTIIDILAWVFIGQTVVYARQAEAGFLPVLIVTVVLAILTIISNLLVAKSHEKFRDLQQHLEKDDEDSQSGG